jgi:hypothetical protein
VPHHDDDDGPTTTTDGAPADALDVARAVKA